MSFCDYDLYGKEMLFGSYLAQILYDGLTKRNISVKGQYGSKFAYHLDKFVIFKEDGSASTPIPFYQLGFGELRLKFGDEEEKVYKINIESEISSRLKAIAGTHTEYKVLPQAICLEDAFESVYGEKLVEDLSGFTKVKSARKNYKN